MGDDDERSVRSQDRSGNNAQAVTERAAGRQPQQLGRDHRARDAEQVRDLFRRAADAIAGVFDEVATTRQLPDADRTARVERVVGDFLQHQAAQLVGSDTGFLLQAFDGAEGGPVFALEFQILSALASKHRSDFENQELSA